jgi:hypothetical protein
MRFLLSVVRVDRTGRTSAALPAERPAGSSGGVAGVRAPDGLIDQPTRNEGNLDVFCLADLA